MFRSVSACAPNSVVTTEFTALVNQEIDIWSNVTVSVNGTVRNERPILSNAGEIISATVTAPTGYLSYKFYPYSLNQRPQTFAVVNKNNYTPTIQVVDARKRWFNYLPKSFVISWYNYDRSIRSVGSNRDIVDIDKVHIVLDAVNFSVVFYSKQQYVISRAFLPAAPIDYKKIPSAFVGYSKDLLVLCSDGKLYRVDYLNRAGPSDQFVPAITTSFNLDDLSYQEDIPGVGSFLSLAKSRLTAQLFPVVTSFDVANNTIWLAGSNVIYTLSLNFVNLATITIPAGEVIMNIACVGINAAVVTRSHKLYHVRANGVVNLIYTSSALGALCTMPDPNLVAVPAGNEQKIYIYQEAAGSLSLVETYTTVDFVPAYCEVFENNLWVTGHDSLQALKFTGNTYQTYDFDEKVTLVSVVEGTVLANHYLKDFVTLNLTGIFKTMPVEFESRIGPLSHIGTSPVLIRMLGQQGLTPVPGPRLTYYVNGKLGDGSISCNSGDYVGVSYRAISEGTFRSTIILGDTAYDYDVKILSSANVGDYYISTITALNRITPGFGSFPGFDSGNEDIGYTGPIGLGFNFNFFGNTYSQIYVTTNGYLAFDNTNLSNNNPTFAGLGVDALYVEPKDLYQGLPINNVDPLNITTGFIENYQIPGVYYQEKQLSDFKSYRIKWVGTSMSSYPLGNTIVAPVVTINNWGEIPMPSLNHFNVNDYISGNGIVLSTRVLSKYDFNQNAVMYFSDASNQYILITSPMLLPKYTTVLLNTTVLGYVSNTAYQSLSANAVLSDSGNTLVVDGTIDPNVALDWSFVRTDTVIGAQSITVDSNSITPVTSISSNFIQVAPSEYTKAVVNQSLYGTGVTVPTKVTGFKTEFQRYQLSAYPSQTLEGANVDITLYSYNIPLQNGAQINYDITSSNANVTSSDFGISMSGTMTVVGNYANLTVPIVSDMTGNETVETFTFSVVPETGLTMSVNVSIFDPGPVQFTTPISTSANSAANILYFVIANNTINQIALNPIYFSKTIIDFGRPHPVGPAALTYQYNRVNLINGTVLNSSTVYNIKFAGNFAVVTPNVSIPVSSNLLFKSNTFAPAYTYEVGFYVGKRFQYIEFFYDNINHSTPTVVGIAAANAAAYSQAVTTNANTSILFGSETFNGNLRYLGTGSFTKINQGFHPRYPEINRVYADLPTEIKYQFKLKQKITANVARLALDYGQLKLNNVDYDGNVTIKDNDVVSMVFPVAKNKMPFAPIVSLGDFQFAFPAVLDAEEFKYAVSNTIYENQPNDTYITSNIAIDQAGQYQLPAYYQVIMPGTALDIEFNILRGLTVTPWISGYAQLQAGDIVQVTNRLTSPRLYDIRDVVLVGPKFYRSALRTSAGVLFNYLNYGTLQNPFVRYYSYDSSGMDYPAYRSSNIRLLSQVGIISSLLVETPGVTFVRNGVPEGNYLASVNTFSNIALQVLLQNYFVSNIKVYQVRIDPWDAANVFIPIGHYAVNNISINSATNLLSTRPLYFSANAVDFGITVATDKIGSRVTGPSNQATSNIASVYQKSGPTSGNASLQFSVQTSVREDLKYQASQIGNLLTGAGSFSNVTSWQIVKDRQILKSNISAVTTVNIDDVTSNAATADINAYLDTLLLSEMTYNTLTVVTQVTGALNVNFNLSGSEINSNVNQSYFESAFTETATLSNIFELAISATDPNSQMTFDDILLVTDANVDMVFNYIGDANQFEKSVQYDFVESVTEIDKSIVFDYDKSVTQLLGSAMSDLDYSVTSIDTETTADFIQSNLFVHGMSFEFETQVNEFGNIFGTTIYTEDYFTQNMSFVFDNIETNIEKVFSAEKTNVSYPINKIFAAEVESYVNGINMKFDAQIQSNINNVPYIFQAQLYVDELWDQGFDPNIGAITANIGVFADNGREGDMGLNKGVPPYRGPFEFYQAYYQVDPNGFLDEQSADAMAVRYVSAGTIQILGTDYWNYRIYFDTNKVCIPRKGLIYPVSWLIKGG